MTGQAVVCVFCGRDSISQPPEFHFVRIGKLAICEEDVKVAMNLIEMSRAQTSLKNNPPTEDNDG